METDFKYKKAFLIIAYGILLQLFITSFYELNILSDKSIHQYVLCKSIVLIFYLFFIGCLLFKRLIIYWNIFFNVGFFLYILIGQYFNPGYHYALIQFMFISVIIFNGFPKMPTLLLALFIIEYNLLPVSDFFVYNSIISSWVASIALERYVNRPKYRNSGLDRKLRYKGIKADLFLHDLKNNLQPLVSLNRDQKDFKKIIKMLQNFNSFNDEEEICFSDVVKNAQRTMNIEAEVILVGSEDFFIDHIDLQTILCNLLNNSHKASQLKNIPLNVKIKNKSSGFSYEDNAGGMTDKQYNFFNQKDFKPYPGHEKNGLGLLLIKKLVEHHEGKLLIKKIPNGTRFEINY